MPTKSEFTYEHNLEEIKKELGAAYVSKPCTKDILIVVHNQLEYVKDCVSSILAHTPLPYHIYIWDNGSEEATKQYLAELEERSPHVTVTSCDTNVGFIYPNNRLAELGQGEYLILLNSDTAVFPMWDKAMTGWLQAYPECAEVGYLGGWLNKDGEGCRWGFGWDVDYLCGWGIRISRETYKQFGLFDEKNLVFAYAEDSDLSLRLREAGKKIYALHADLVCHYENKTINEVMKGMDIRDSFNRNHNYIRTKWEKYLAL